MCKGLRVVAFAPHSIYALLWIEHGDVIRRLNGYEIDSADRGLEVAHELRDSIRIDVEIERPRRAIRKTCRIE